MYTAETFELFFFLNYALVIVDGWVDGSNNGDEWVLSESPRHIATHFRGSKTLSEISVERVVE